ncbi:Phosphomannomutase [Cavenderia fasciculata]|uniref:Phosphomannomutase n=1 Tax=Cavenderia fasciculata TaxID=261658 RepID=F4PWV7_CACFS|nr:Phosphomannomutase [Cavenderia fasciculata]EGG19760.1 Phosphomannomutase [Cavenderia fasciculata]|eukprot:XP_004358106.1 Phosphomannomutase [Cavenderia fasciculata]
MSLIRSISGVRGVVGSTLTPQVIVQHIVAFTRLLASDAYKQSHNKKIVVGRDSRVSGPWVEMIVNGCLISTGHQVIHLDIATTPTVQFIVQSREASGGIVITSSHNPIEWNGLKFIGPDGLFVSPDNCDRLFGLADQDPVPIQETFVKYNQLGSIERMTTANQLHIDSVFKLPYINVDKIRAKKFKVCLDSVNGAGGPIMTSLLQQMGCEVIGINIEPNGVFAHTPEPVPANLGDLCKAVVANKADFGVAVDPDVDRCVLIDETGRPLGEEYTLAFAVEFILGPDVGKRGTVCKNLSSSRVTDDIAAKYGSQVYCAPVGEIQVAQKMIETKAVIGGEGNGGVMLPDSHIGRDAIVAAVLALQLLANRTTDTPMTIGQFKRTLPQYEIVKLKAAIEGLDPDAILDAYKAQYKDTQGMKVNIDDGLKIDAPEWWVHLRKSNTEHIIRVIAEAKTEQEATKIANQFIQEIESKRKK